MIISYHLQFITKKLLQEWKNYDIPQKSENEMKNDVF